MVREYSARGLVLERALELAGISRSQYYYVKKPGKPGRQATKTTQRMAEGTMVICDNAEVVQTIEGIRTRKYILPAPTTRCSFAGN
ncbi:MAG: hypothetical protein JPMHGGIA_01855 [Saprospiraceae bacterium]|jgi:hypothetical protein|nr:hypothetical protein [Saprospiraceae bacterium]